MGKKKSVLCLIFLTLLIIAMGFFSLVSFKKADGITYFNSAIAMTGKDAALGKTLGGDHYYGGGYSAVYYPEGVVSSKQYRDDLDAIADETEREEYVNKYAAFGALYLEKETVCNDDGSVSESFAASFEDSFNSIKNRYERLQAEGVRVEKANGYTVRVFLPQNLVEQTTGSQPDLNGGTFSDVVNAFAMSGDFTISYGSDASTATTILPENKRGAVIGDYVKGASLRTGADGTAYIVVNFTAKGREIVKAQTAGADETSQTMFFNVGDEQAISLTVSQQIDQSSLYISGGGLTGRTAQARAILIDSVLHDSEGLVFTADDFAVHEASFGPNALLLLYIAVGVAFVGMMLFFFIRYGLLGFAHLYSFLLFFFALCLCAWAIPSLYIGVNTVAAALLAAVLLSVSNAVSFESAKKEFALGKTMTVSVKQGYKKCFWHLFDLHIVLAVLSVLTFAISLSGLSAFALTLTLGVVFSGLCSLGFARLSWACMMSLSGRKDKFCLFKNESRRALAEDEE